MTRALREKLTIDVVVDTVTRGPLGSSGFWDMVVYVTYVRRSSDANRGKNAPTAALRERTHEMSCPSVPTAAVLLWLATTSDELSTAVLCGAPCARIYSQQ